MKFILKSTQWFSKIGTGKPKIQISPQSLAEFRSQRIPHTPSKLLPITGKRNILITSALPYVNNTPHLGNIIGAVLSADVYARFCRLMGHNVMFICGTDEYGTATEVKALKQGTTPKAICDRYHQVHKNIYQWFDISFDYFGRTSCEAHSTITQDIFRRLLANQALTQKESEQLHCSHCDLFLADRFVQGKCRKCGAATRGDQCQGCSIIFNSLTEQLSDLKCSVCSNTPQPRKTTHFYLKLKEQAERLKQWLVQEGGMDSWTNNAKGITKGWLHSPPEDRCITRDLKWGVPVPHPGFEKKVFYVWFQAPIGYISITADHLGEGYKAWWMPEKERNVELRQFMGKDNTLFHSIINPATLIATEQPWIRPTHLAVTEYLNYEGGKFSKSHGVGVFGDQCRQTGIPVDCWRYYLLRVRPETFDSEFSWTDFAQKCNKELLNSTGNLVQRVLKYSYKSYGPRILPLSDDDLGPDELHCLEDFTGKYRQFLAVMDKTHLLQGGNLVAQFSDCLNQYVSKTEFWRSTRKEINLAFLVHMLRVYSLIAEPFLPSLAAKINYLLGAPSSHHYPSPQTLRSFLLTCLLHSSGLKDPIHLVPEISPQQISSFKAKFGPVP